jgi:hypothetical protein
MRDRDDEPKALRPGPREAELVKASAQLPPVDPDFRLVECLCVPKTRFCDIGGEGHLEPVAR